MSLLEVTNLRVRYDTPRGPVWAVDQVSFKLDAGETVALVGESGSGKSTTALAILGLVAFSGGTVETGEIWFGGKNLLALREDELRAVRASEIALVFQDATAALNPFLTIGLQIAEVLEVHRGLSRREALVAAGKALGDVGIAEPEARLASFPHELSGGQRQRALIAMSLIAKPKVVIADEPTTALDPALALLVLDLLRREREQNGAGVLLVSHDLELVASEAKRVHVMYAGRVAESADADELFAAPWHPYTAALWRARPRLDGERPKRLAAVAGAPVDPAALPTGCAFHPRCEFVVERCRRERPDLSGLLRAEGAMSLRSGRRSACFEKERLALPREEASTP
ncbi:MAG: ABC transporter ATP-binding protein [Planctomycetes bacterium]|nr:ABC transporter ATP-binding protein [Planctomycetota bacterium]